jgi:RND family efflux transporter MFP subunit
MKFYFNKIIYFVVFVIASFLATPLLLLAEVPEESSVPELDCFIEPFIVVNLGSEVIGIIKDLEVDRGDFVEKGQVLARLDIRVEEATLELMRAQSETIATIEARKVNLEFAIREHERKKKLYKKNIIALDETDLAETKMLIAEHELQEAMEQKHIADLELKRAKELVERRIIRSPIRGVVVEKFLSIGELVDKQPILKLAQLDPLNVEVIAPITLLNSFKVGDSAEITPEYPFGKSYIGKVKIVDSVVDATSGTFGIRIELPNPDYTIPAGLQSSVRFLGNKTVSYKSRED